MAQRKQNERSVPVRRIEQARFDKDGYERPGPHADVIFQLDTVDQGGERPQGLE